jgi:hypothetical protein
MKFDPEKHHRRSVRLQGMITRKTARISLPYARITANICLAT